MPPANKPSAATGQARPKKEDAGILRIVAVASVLVAVAVSVYLNHVGKPSFEEPFSALSGQRTSPTPDDQEAVPSRDADALKAYRIVGQVPRLEWDIDRDFADWALELDRPVILTNSPVHRWPALKKWTPQYLAANSRSLPLEFKTAGDPVFIYSQRKPLSTKVAGLEFVTPYNLTNIDLEAFWERVSGQQEDIPSHERYLYFTGCISRSQDELKDFPGLVRDTQPFHQFSADAGEHSMNLWLGSPGVVAHTHNDEDPNWAAQIYGHKRWILSPPSEAWKLYPYPNMHGFRSQSQVDFKTRNSIDGRARASGSLPDLEDNGDLFPDFGNITAFEALLSPGEILYIPPFWYHRVVTEDTSIAVNTWSHLPGGSPHTFMQQVPLPFETDWDLGRKVSGLKIFAEAYLDAFTDLNKHEKPNPSIISPTTLDSKQNGDGKKDLAFNLLRKQYNSLFYGAFGRKGAASLEKDLKPLCNDASLSEFEKNIYDKINSGVYISALMEQLTRLKNVDARRLLFLAHFEDAIYALLEPNLIYPFIRDCLP